MPIGPALTPNTPPWWLKPPNIFPWFGMRFQRPWPKPKPPLKTATCRCRLYRPGLTNCGTPEVKVRTPRPLLQPAKPKQMSPLRPVKLFRKSPACCCNLKRKWPWGTAKPCRALPLCCVQRSKPRVCNSIPSLPSRCKPPWPLLANSKVGNASVRMKSAFNSSPKPKHCSKRRLLIQ